ncbi:hypothetical protein [Lysinibacillus sphaericus]|uniref:hypothetical protein n=1 Tax=Lysinibacillus sphaericus TaxID=1421 RepID=UPI0018CC92AC|nr:hypothetical protein [Lysinibacillus sphaericus]
MKRGFSPLTRSKKYLVKRRNHYNKEIIEFNISKRPTLDFVLELLHQVLPIIQKATYRATIHSDQGWHYNIMHG